MKKFILVILFCLFSSSAFASETSVMYEAIRRGDAVKVQELFDAGFDPNQNVISQETGLMMAADKGQTQIVEIFLKHGADVNRKSYDVIFQEGSTPAMHAIKHAKVMKMLIAAGVDLSFQFKDETVLAKALDQGTSDVIKLLLNSGVKVSNIYEASILGDIKFINQYGDQFNINKRYGKYGNTPLIGCIKKGNAEMTELLLKKGANPNIGNSSGETPILIAIKSNDLNIVKLLAQYGADLNCKRLQIGLKQTIFESPLALAVNKPEVFKTLVESGARPTDLLEAVTIGDAESIKQLVSNGTDINAGEWLTPLMVAADGGNIEIVKLLINNGAGVDKSNRNGVTPLMMAAGKGNLDAVKELLAAGAKVDATSRVLTFSALAAAATNGHIEIVNELVKVGADVNLHSGGALSAAAFSGDLAMVKHLIHLGAKTSRDNIYRALLDKHYDIVEYLLSLGMDINEKDRNGATYLEDAVVMGDEKMVKLLLSHGADINSRDANGVTALGHAGIYSKYFLYDLLQSNGATI